MAYNLQKFQSDSSQIEIITKFCILLKFFRILDQIGLLFDINLKFLQIVGSIVATSCENLRSIAFKLRSAQIFLILQKFFSILDQLGLVCDAQVA